MAEGISETEWIEQDLARARQLRREVTRQELPEGPVEQQIALVAKQLECDLIVLGQHETMDGHARIDHQAIARDSTCAVCVVTPPRIPQDVVE